MSFVPIGKDINSIQKPIISSILIGRNTSRYLEVHRRLLDGSIMASYGKMIDLNGTWGLYKPWKRWLISS